MSKWENKVGTRFYFTWRNMRRRCNNPLDDSYSRYGGRGITYDKSWDSYDNFYKDMYDGYAELLKTYYKPSIDRIDNDGNYSKENCRWVTFKQNANNTSANVVIEGKTLTEWFDEMNLTETERMKAFKRHSSYGATTLDELLYDGMLVTKRAIVKNNKPCVICCTKQGTMRKHGKYPVRKDGMCNTCYCKDYRQKRALQTCKS